MDTNVVFRKTPKGLEEIERRTYRLPPRERLLLIQIDGRRNLAMLSGKAGGEREGLDTANRLLAGGFIEPMPPAINSVTTAMATRTTALPPASRLTQPPPRPASPHRPETHPAAAPTPPAHVHGQTPQARPPEVRPALLQRQAATVAPRPASWLTSTVAHLTNLFNANPEEAAPAAPAPRSRRTTEYPADPAIAMATPGRSGRGDPLATTVIHAPLFDLTERHLAPSGLNQSQEAALLTPAIRTLENRTAPPSVAERWQTTEARWPNAQTDDDIPMLDLTAAMDTPYPGEAGRVTSQPSMTEGADPFTPGVSSHRPHDARTNRTGHEFLPLPGESRLRHLASGPRRGAEPSNQVDASNGCLKQAACPGCVHCPVNAVSSARNFMKEQVLRLSDNPRSPLVMALEQSRSLVDLQRQFEGWLRELLRTAAGCAEAPALAAELQRMLLQ